MTTRVRFAPSPTGYLHIGGVRTALFNWLWARKTGGAFVLRIEDTDQERSTDESVKVILDSMKWLGLDWDEGPGVGGGFGPYTQMQRLPLYREYADKLMAENKAYRCYCTKEELEAARTDLKKRDPKATFHYPRTCRDRKDTPDKPYVVRFVAPQDGSTVYVDKVFGEVRTPNSAQQDFVLLRSDGVPLYNFGCVVDDITMGITLVARGRDHMVNTPPQIMLYEAFGRRPPEFAHLPMMLAMNGEKLSKRHGAVSVKEYQDQGYLPDALLSYLVRFGWSHGDQEVFSRDALIAAFNWEACGRGDGKFDPKKLLAVEFEFAKSEALLPDHAYAARVLPFLAARGLSEVSHGEVERALFTIRPRARTMTEAAEALDFFFREPPQMDAAAAQKHLGPASAVALETLADVVLRAPAWSEKDLETYVPEALEKEGLQFKEIAQAARVALTGKTASPGLYQVLFVLGRERSVARLRRSGRAS